MKYAITDTESNELFDFAKPADSEGQPRLASLGIITLDTDSKEPPKEYEYFIQPDGWEMTPEASAVNGLTTEFLKGCGIPVAMVLDVYGALIDAGYVICSYNAQFDTKVMRGELRRAGKPDRFETTPNICLMRACTNVVKVPKKSGGGYKFPKLSEACAFFNIEQPAAHSAMGDTRSALSIFNFLRADNALPEPSVHFAANKPTSTT